MNWRGIGLGAAACFMAWALPALAQGHGPPLPGNSASCIYESMPAEDREMALLLISREFASGGRFGQPSRNLETVNELIEESHQRCLSRFNWSLARSQAASGYALTALLGAALEQSLQSLELDVAPLEAFYRDNRAVLAGRDKLTAAQLQRLATFVTARGWTEPREAELALAGLFVESLMLKDQAQRQFR